jgi:hypothetical protein
MIIPGYYDLKDKLEEGKTYIFRYLKQVILSMAKRIWLWKILSGSDTCCCTGTISNSIFSRTQRYVAGLIK